MKIRIDENVALDEVEVTIRAPRIDAQITSIVSMLSAYDRRVHGTDDAGCIHLLNARDILYFEALENKVFAYADDLVLQSSLKLEDVERAFSSVGFARASRTFVVNLAHVNRIAPQSASRLSLALSNGEIVIASRTYAARIKKRLGIG